MVRPALSTLLKHARACQVCAPHLPLGARPVLQADARARILIAGQAPGRRVHETGIPFNDVSGDRLRTWLGIERDTFYDASKIALLPMGFCYPGSGASGDLPPRPECAPLWREQLLQRLPNIALTLVIGQYAMAWHLGDRRQANLTATVAAWRSFWPEVLPMPHPSPRNQRWMRNNPWFEADVLPALQRRVQELIGR